MKAALYLVVVIAALAFAEETSVSSNSSSNTASTDTVSNIATNTSFSSNNFKQGEKENVGTLTADVLNKKGDALQGATNNADQILNSILGGGDMQQAVAGDLDLKMLMMEDGTSKGKCYCSCNLNNQPVFMEIDSSNLPVTYGFVET